MKLQPGTKSREGGESAWKLLGSDGETAKEFFVTEIRSSVISFEIMPLIGGALSDDEKQLIFNEIQGRNPGREVAWPR